MANHRESCIIAEQKLGLSPSEYLCTFSTKASLIKCGMFTKKGSNGGYPMEVCGNCEYYKVIEADEPGLFQGDEDGGEWFITYTGKTFHITEPVSDEIDIRDIAHGLSHICRYMGQTVPFYSVAEHCCRMAAYFISDDTRDLALLALLHDSPEAYFGDIHSVIKRTKCPELVKYEQLVLNIILDKYCPEIKISYEFKRMCARVHELDVLIRTPEVTSLLSKPGDWKLPPFNYPRIVAWESHYAEKQYLKCFQELTNVGFNCEP